MTAGGDGKTVEVERAWEVGGGVRGGGELRVVGERGERGR